MTEEEIENLKYIGVNTDIELSESGYLSVQKICEKLKSLNRNNNVILNVNNKLEFNDCNLENSEFYNTKMKDLDLSTSIIDGILLTSNNLKGVCINSYQATLLIRGFGVNIKDV